MERRESYFCYETFEQDHEEAITYSNHCDSRFDSSGCIRIGYDLPNRIVLLVQRSTLAPWYVVAYSCSDLILISILRSVAFSIYGHILELFHKLDKKTDKWYRGRSIVKSLEFSVTLLTSQHSKSLREDNPIRNKNYKSVVLLAFFCLVGAVIGSIPRFQSPNFIFNFAMPLTGYVIGYPAYITVVMSVELYGAIKEANQLHQSIPLRSGLASFISWAADFTDLQSSLHSWTSRHRLAVSTYLVQTMLHLALLFLSTTFDISGLLPFSPSCT
jgi:hypothetical protein